MDTLSQWFGECQQWLFETLVQPALFHLGLSNFIEDGYDATMWLLVGLLQIALLVLVFGPLQRLRPVEPVTDRRQIGIDVLYTLIHRLGVFRLALFFTVDPLWDSVFGQLHVWGFAPFQLDQYWPGVTDRAWVSLIIYLLLFDAVDYFYHRAQHRFGWLWSLHAVHHSQRQMTIWSDDRNHLLDDMLRDVVVVFVSQLVGVPPAQFVAVVAITQLAQSFSHANLRLHFGAIGERLLVSPRFHRHHHSIAYDASSPGPAGGYNFAALFPIWDVLFRTARFGTNYGPTGIHDQLPEQGGRDYGRGFWSQQWLALKRMTGRERDPETAAPAAGTGRPGLNWRGARTHCARRSRVRAPASRSTRAVRPGSWRTPRRRGCPARCPVPGIACASLRRAPPRRSRRPARRPRPGRAPGANTPCQDAKRKPGRPASASVGVSGKAGERSAVTASRSSLPPLTSGAAAPSIITSTWPEATSLSAGALPL